MKRYILVILTLILSFEISAREVYSLNNGWRFFYGDAVSSDFARQVTLPHIWNSDGSQSQTIGNYMRSLNVPAEWQGRRVFIRFYGASSVADLSVNSRYVGTHRGAGTAFTFEITDFVRYGMPNSIRVRVDNAQRNDLLPLAQEENRYGGLHRSVELIVTDRVAISPLHYSTDGVFVTPEKISTESVEGNVTLHLATDRHDRTATIQMAILSPDRDTVFIDNIRTKFDSKSDKTSLNIPFRVSSPKLWCEEPGEQPIYTFVTKLSTGTFADSVAVKTGFRSISIGSDHLLRINGHASRIRGVALYNDHAGVGSAVLPHHVSEDMAMIKELGANLVRMVTYPASAAYLDECDRHGIGVWCDIPLVNSPFLADVPYTTSPALAENGREQLREIIAQNYNRPSILFWGIFSKLAVPGDDPRPYIRELNSLAKKLDPSRPTVAVSNQDGDINFITDLIVWHQTLGWQTGDVQDVQVWKEQLRDGWSNLRSGLTYSAGGSPQHQDSLTVRPRLDRNWHPERWQTIFHESYMRTAGNDPLFWGIVAGNMFDFGSARQAHIDGSTINDHGLVSYDRSVRKDAFYVYKAAWNRHDPFVHIAEKRWSIRENPEQTIRAYSNQQQLELIVNGVSRGMMESTDGIFIWDKVLLHEGANTIEVVATDSPYSDHSTIIVGKSVK